MVARERRFKATEAALIGALLVVFATLLFPLLVGEERGASVLASEPGQASTLRESTLHASGEPTVAPAGSSALPLLSATSARSDRELKADVLAIIEEAKRCAQSNSDGRVQSDDIIVAVHARKLGSGDMVLRIEDDLALRPASGMKLVTTAAALVLLGSDWHFETGFDAAGEVSGGALHGDLIVRAGGDPLYAGDESQLVDVRLDRVATALRLKGVEEIRGNLLLDLGGFDYPGPGPEWPPASQYWQEHCALAAGLTANAGVLATRVTSTSLGQPATIEVWPAHHGLESRYTTVTVAEKVNDVRVGATAKRVTVGGKIGQSIGVVEASFSHPDPVALFESSFLAALSRAGIRFSGEVRVLRNIAPAQRLYTMRSSLRSTLIPVNSDSANSVADQVFLATGRATFGRGSREAGGLATAKALEQLGVPADGLAQVDGSGLSRANRVSARQMATLLAAVLGPENPMRSAFRDSLAIAGVSGTLENRMRSGAATGHVFAKTGWISGTSSLSGLAEGADGVNWVFSILVEYPQAEAGLNKYCFKPMHDAIAERLVAGAGS